MNLRPLHDRILARRLDEASGECVDVIVIPDFVKETPHQGDVLADEERTL